MSHRKVCVKGIVWGLAHSTCQRRRAGAIGTIGIAADAPGKSPEHFYVQVEAALLHEDKCRAGVFFFLLSLGKLVDLGLPPLEAFCSGSCSVPVGCLA